MQAKDLKDLKSHKIQINALKDFLESEIRVAQRVPQSGKKGLTIISQGIDLKTKMDKEISMLAVVDSILEKQDSVRDKVG